MDRIPYAFAKALGDVVKYDCAGHRDSQDGEGRQDRLYAERIGEVDRGGLLHLHHASHTPLKKIPNDFSAPYKKVIDECTYASAYKIAWESRRFWEQDYNIYGGLEFVNVDAARSGSLRRNVYPERACW